jgi:hypothetical protein
MKSLRTLVIIILLLYVILITLGIFSVAVFQIQSSDSGDSSGWWQVLLEGLNFPLVAFALYSLIENINRASKRPQLEIGIYNSNISTTQISWSEPLASMVALPNNSDKLALVVQNRGKAPARFLRVSVEIQSRELFWHLDGYSLFKPTGVNLTFNGGADYILYPKEEEVFLFYLSSGKPATEIDKTDSSKSLQCTVWAEHLEKPVTKTFTIEYGKQ